MNFRPTEQTFELLGVYFVLSYHLITEIES